MTSNFDLVIVGGGIIGAWALHHAVERYPIGKFYSLIAIGLAMGQLRTRQVCCWQLAGRTVSAVLLVKAPSYTKRLEISSRFELLKRRCIGLPIKAFDRNLACGGRF